MPDGNKGNICFFDGSSMAELYEALQQWQNENGKRFLSITIQPDRGRFCCIALTDPTGVVRTEDRGSYSFTFGSPI